MVHYVVFYLAGTVLFDALTIYGSLFVCTAQLVALDVMVKVNPSGELRERHLTAAVAVALVSAVTGYRYHPKVQALVRARSTAELRSCCI